VSTRCGFSTLCYRPHPPLNIADVRQLSILSFSAHPPAAPSHRSFEQSCSTICKIHYAIIQLRPTPARTTNHSTRQDDLFGSTRPTQLTFSTQVQTSVSVWKTLQAVGFTQRTFVYLRSPIAIANSILFVSTPILVFLSPNTVSTRIDGFWAVVQVHVCLVVGAVLADHVIKEESAS
jgi:hypothetical protein